MVRRTVRRSREADRRDEQGRLVPRNSLNNLFLTVSWPRRGTFAREILLDPS